MMATQKQVETATAELVRTTDLWSRAKKELVAAKAAKDAATALVSGLQPQVDQKAVDRDLAQHALLILLTEGVVDPNA